MNNYKERTGTYIIAEVGINHGGDIEEAKRLIKASAEAGADGVKIQVRDLASVYTDDVLKDPLKAEQGTQYILSHLEKTTFSFDEVSDIFNFAKSLDVDFFATPFDLKSAEFINGFDPVLYKVGSPDFTNLPLLKRLVSYNKPLIISTGMSNEEEIGQVITFLKGAEADFALLHCNSTYPSSYVDLNLKYIPELKKISGVEVGYSGHERGFAPTLAAVALGATIVERHITFDPTQDGADQSSSLSVEDFSDMVKEIRNVELSLGEAHRKSNQGELANRVTLAKSIVAGLDIKEGTIITEDMLTTKSPAKGVSPLQIDKFIGQKATRDIAKDSFVLFDYIIPEEEKPNFDIPNKWGVVGRLNDFEEFLDIRPDLVEIHLTWRDIDDYASKNTRFMQEKYEQDLVVHAPEYYNDKLIDFSSDDSKVTEYSIEMLERSVGLAKSLAPKFKGLTDSEGPRLIVHPGGHFQNPTDSNRGEQYKRLIKNLRNVDTTGVRVLVENMPPKPWYFGGQWYNTIFMESAEISQFAKEMGWGVCYDLSHAQLYCNSVGKTLEDFTKNILGHIDYLHVSDAKGTTQEGMQLGHGDLNMEHLFAILSKLDVGFIPEIWNGHLKHGEGMKTALRTIESLLGDKLSGDSCCTNKSCNGRGPHEKH